jgi:hypothetical protein
LDYTIGLDFGADFLEMGLERSEGHGIPISSIVLGAWFRLVSGRGIKIDMEFLVEHGYIG